MNFPVTQSFDFFRNPQSVIDYANTLEFFEQIENERKNYPGKRTGQLWEINSDFFNYVCRRQLSLFYSHDEVSYEIDYTANMSFQKISSEDTIQGEGLIHQDHNADMTSIIYLSPELNDNGTNIWIPDIEWETEPNAANMHNSYWDPNITQESKLNTINDIQSGYTLASTMNSIYNSCIMFDGSYSHSANLKLNKGEERLTLITFYYKIKSNRKPISNMKKF